MPSPAARVLLLTGAALLLLHAAPAPAPAASSPPHAPAAAPPPKANKTENCRNTSYYPGVSIGYYPKYPQEDVVVQGYVETEAECCQMCALFPGGPKHPYGLNCGCWDFVAGMPKGTGNNCVGKHICTTEKQMANHTSGRLHVTPPGPPPYPAA